jgi:hypothetical protein
MATITAVSLERQILLEGLVGKCDVDAELEHQCGVLAKDGTA